MCVRPVAIRDPKTRKVYLVPCGKCLECRRDYQNEWIFRLSQEMKHCPVPIFVTLTYNDEHLPLGDNGNVTQSVLCKSDLQLFLKRLRKTGTLGQFRFFAVGEYGSKYNRCHYHLVIMPKKYVPVSVANAVIEEAWTLHNEPLGFVKVRFCTDKQVHYVCKYMNKLDDRKHLVKPFRLYSKHLGLCYLTEQVIKYYLTSFDRTCPNGKYRISLPRYYRRKLDKIAECDPFMATAGLNYTDLLGIVNPHQPQVDSPEWWFKEFQKKLQSLDDLSYTLFEQHNMPLSLPNLNQVLGNMIASVPKLVNAIAESDRKLDVCKIRNGLIRAKVPVTFEPNINFLILNE